MRPSEWYLKSIEQKRNIKIPSILFKNEVLEEFDRVIQTKQPFLISRFYKNYKNYINTDFLEFLENELKKPRKRLTKEDKKLIEELTSIKEKCPEFYFDIVGNIFHISDLVDEISKAKNLSKTIRVSLMLWAYLNIVELIAKYVSEYLLILIKENKREKEFKEFIKKFKNGKHPEIGTILKSINKLGILDSNEIENTVFKKNNLIRRRIAHANIYYDRYTDKLFLSNGESYSLDNFEEEFLSLYEFLLELLYYYNEKQIELIKNFDRVFNQLARYFHWLERSHLKRKFQSIIFEWEK